MSCTERPYPVRRQHHLQGWDYSRGIYFISCNTQHTHDYFGTVANATMRPNQAGKMVERWYYELQNKYPGLVCDEFICMPNHIHAVIILSTGGVIGWGGPTSPPVSPPVPLSQVVQWFKTMTTNEYIRHVKASGWRRFEGKLWQRDYWDIHVRDAKMLQNIRNYIRDNPTNYHAVANIGVPKHLGDLSLLNRPLLGFLSSRDSTPTQDDTCISQLLSFVSVGQMPGCAVISGFLSPLERKAFWACLQHRVPLVWIKPWSLNEALSTDLQEAVAAGDMLIISPFANIMSAPSAKRASWCNLYAITHASKIMIGHLTAGGMLSCLLAEAGDEKEITIMMA